MKAGSLKVNFVKNEMAVGSYFPCVIGVFNDCPGRRQLCAETVGVRAAIDLNEKYRNIYREIKTTKNVMNSLAMHVKAKGFKYFMGVTMTPHTEHTHAHIKLAM